MTITDPWEQAIADAGWELYYWDQDLVNGALDLAGLAEQIEEFEELGWELHAFGHPPDADYVQVCLRRPVPGRDAHIEQIKILRDQFRARAN